MAPTYPTVLLLLVPLQLSLVRQLLLLLLQLIRHRLHLLSRVKIKNLASTVLTTGTMGRWTRLHQVDIIDCNVHGRRRNAAICTELTMLA